jgi:NAD(P)-dependent dehydrogenase (short-subunit alcohol dehydrogenase family)
MPARKVSVVTGASSGFGRLIAERLARSGHIVHATMRDVLGRNRAHATALAQLAAREHLALCVEEMDVTNDEQVTRTVDGIVRDEGRIDILINNAGTLFGGVTEAFTAKEFGEQLEVNVVGAFRVSRAVLPTMRRQQSGLLIHMSGVAGRLAVPFFGLYCASKWALDALGESLRYELAPFGVDSVIVEPGPFHTRLLAQARRPADQVRSGEYGPTAAIPNTLFAAFDQLFDTDPIATDPQRVVNAVCTLIDTPTGQRPLRTVVGVDFGVRGLNAATEDCGPAMLAALGLPHLESVEKAKGSLFTAAAAAAPRPSPAAEAAERSS